MQHTAPVTAKPDSRPRQQGARYKYPTSCSLLFNPAFPARHAHIAHTYRFPSSHWAIALDRYTGSALRSRSRLNICPQQRKKERKKERKPSTVFGVDIHIHYSEPALSNWIHNSAASTFSCCKPTAHCNILRDSIDLLEKLCLFRKLRPALQRLANLTAKMVNDQSP